MPCNNNSKTNSEIRTIPLTITQCQPRDADSSDRHNITRSSQSSAVRACENQEIGAAMMKADDDEPVIHQDNHGLVTNSSQPVERPVNSTSEQPVSSNAIGVPVNSNINGVSVNLNGVDVHKLNAIGVYNNPNVNGVPVNLNGIDVPVVKEIYIDHLIPQADNCGKYITLYSLMLVQVLLV